MPSRLLSCTTPRSTFAAALAISFGLMAGMLPAQAQSPASDGTLDTGDRVAVVAGIAELLTTRYVYPEIAERAGADLTARLEAGEFDGVTDPGEFADLLTDILRASTEDRHVGVRTRAPEQAQMEREDPEEARAEAARQSRARNYGFERVERMEGNIGYVEMRYFDGSPEARPTAAAAMNFIANADAVIFDMRPNGGGNPDMIRYVSSWFFGEPTHLNSLYWREGDRTEEFWTLDEIPGEPRPDVPIFVLTSDYTFSGAEEFSYNMRTQERATLIGEVTGGGANPGGVLPIDDRFEMFVPMGAAVNPITGTNWEGVGVTPHIEVDADDALDVALEQARAAAETYRAGRR